MRMTIKEAMARSSLVRGPERHPIDTPTSSEGTPPYRNQTGNVPLRFFSADKRPIELKKLITRFRAACDSGYRAKIEAKAPKGWEGTVKKLKKAKGVDNPFALAWWMKEQGYSPGGSK